MNVLIVDDEQPARERMIRLLSAHAECKIVGEAENGLLAIEKIRELKPDVVFMDIEMPELSGIEVAGSLLSYGEYSPQIVFVTAFSEFAIRAFEVHALDYLVKPVSIERLAKAIEKLKRVRTVTNPWPERVSPLQEIQKKIAIKIAQRTVLIEVQKISSIVAKDHYSAVQFEGRELLSDESLERMSVLLASPQFFRIHRSAIVNLDFVKELERIDDRKYLVVLSDPLKTKLPVSRDQLTELKLRLGVK